MVSKTEAKSKRLGSIARCVKLHQTKVDPVGGRYPDTPTPVARGPRPERLSDPEVLAVAEAKRARRLAKRVP